MKHMILAQKGLWLMSIPPQSVGQSATATGTGMDVRVGRQVCAIYCGGALGAASTAILKFQGKKRSDGNWEDLLNKSGTTLQFPAANLIDAGLGENNVLLGTIVLTEAQVEAYSEVRPIYTRGAEAVANLVAVVLVAFDLYREPNPVEALIPDQLLGTELVSYPA